MNVKWTFNFFSERLVDKIDLNKQCISEIIKYKTIKLNKPNSIRKYGAMNILIYEICSKVYWTCTRFRHFSKAAISLYNLILPCSWNDNKSQELG